MAGWGKGKKGPGVILFNDFFDPSWAGMKGCGKPCFGGPMFPPGPDVGFAPFLAARAIQLFSAAAKVTSLFWRQR